MGWGMAALRYGLGLNGERRKDGLERMGWEQLVAGSW